MYKTLIAGATVAAFFTPFGISAINRAEHNICSGTRHESRYLGNGVHVGCVTGYGVREGLTRSTSCGIPLNDRRFTTAVSTRYLPKVRCGSLIKVCYLRCIIVTRTDTGPYDPTGSVCGYWSIPDCNRDMDLSSAASLAIGKNPAAWGDPVLVYWKVVRYGH